MSQRLALGLLVLSLVPGVACGDSDGTTDGARHDGGAASDSAVGDAGAADAGATDAGSTDAGGGDAGTATGSRGYWTTPGELRAAHERAERGEQPWADAEARVLEEAGAPDDWTYGTLDGEVDCGGSGGGDPDVPALLSDHGGGPVLLAKAYAWILTRDDRYAAAVREIVLDLTDTTFWGGEVYNGSNQCILNLSWFVPRFIQAADLLADWPGWTAADRDAFQRWLADEVYRKTSWASQARHNNWGTAGSFTSAAIADYLVTGDVAELVERDGTRRSLHEAWLFHLDNQLARMNGTAAMDARCDALGIQHHGGIPEELRRGSSGCDATHILEMDASYVYQHAYIQSAVAHAELLQRRGTTALFDNLAGDGRGSIRNAMRFVFANPTLSWPWSSPHSSTMEIAYRYYRDPDMCDELRCEATDRVMARHNRVLGFATLTHGFPIGEEPSPPPSTVPP